jgi:N-dimethylarginine dimethylaminohydrolase
MCATSTAAFATAISQPVDSESATFLMCPPHFYDVDYVINPWMAGNVHASSHALAAEQWQNLYDTVSRSAKVHLIDPEPGSPDMVFTANAGLEHNGTVVLSSFFHVERQGEEAYFRCWFSRAGYTVIEIPRATSFEGEGDALFSADGSCLWVAHGTRTLLSSHPFLKKIWDVEVSSLRLIDPRFYHLDTCFAPLPEDYILYFAPAFDQASIARIEAFYPPEKRILVTEADALCFACNAISIGKTVILNRISSQLETQLKAKGFHPVQVDLREFLKAGGAAKCLVMKLGDL